MDAAIIGDALLRQAMRMDIPSPEPLSRPTAPVAASPLPAAPPAEPLPVQQAVVIATRALPPAAPAQPSTWILELDLGGTRIEASSDRPIPPGSQLDLRTAASGVLRVSNVRPPPAETIMQEALRAALPRQQPLREAVQALSSLRADRALPVDLQPLLDAVLARIPSPTRVQDPLGLRRAFADSGPWLEARLARFVPEPARAEPGRPPATPSGSAPGMAPARDIPAAPGAVPLAAEPGRRLPDAPLANAQVALAQAPRLPPVAGIDASTGLPVRAVDTQPAPSSPAQPMYDARGRVTGGTPGQDSAALQRAPAQPAIPAAVPSGDRGASISELPAIVPDLPGRVASSAAPVPGTRPPSTTTGPVVQPPADPLPPAPGAREVPRTDAPAPVAPGIVARVDASAQTRPDARGAAGIVGRADRIAEPTAAAPVNPRTAPASPVASENALAGAPAQSPRSVSYATADLLRSAPPPVRAEDLADAVLNAGPPRGVSPQPTARAPGTAPPPAAAADATPPPSNVAPGQPALPRVTIAAGTRGPVDQQAPPVVAAERTNSPLPPAPSTAAVQTPQRIEHQTVPPAAVAAAPGPARADAITTAPAQSPGPPPPQQGHTSAAVSPADAPYRMPRQATGDTVPPPAAPLAPPRPGIPASAPASNAADIAPRAAIPGTAPPVDGAPVQTKLAETGPAPGTDTARMRPDAAPRREDYRAGDAAAVIGRDLKAALSLLVAGARAWLVRNPAIASALHQAHAMPAPATRAEEFPLYTARGVAEQPVGAALAAHLAHAAGTPRAEVPPRAQRAEADAIEQLLRYAEGALARTRVHQYGAVHESRSPQDAPPVPTWTTEIPLLHRHGVDLLQLRIERHDRSTRESAGDTRVWQVLMCLDCAATGPLHALLRLAGRRLSATLWAERAGTLRAARAALAELDTALRAQGVEVERLECIAGRPAAAVGARFERLLDVRT